jgi:hypothetical protein
VRRDDNSSSHLRKYSVALASGAAVALFDHLLALWMVAHGLHPDMTSIDEILLGIFAGTLIFVIQLSHERQQDRMNEKLRTIQLMNHHVRNALQAIIDSAHIHGHFDEIQTSVNRIAWALQEILPGERSDDDEDINGPYQRPAA